jgi:DnaK suppressor protein
MPTKSKAPAKSAGVAKPAKAAAKRPAKLAPKASGKTTTAAARKPAPKPAAKPAPAKKAAPAAAKSAKAAKAAPAVKAAKAAPLAPVKAAAKPVPTKSSGRGSPRLGAVPSSPPNAVGSAASIGLPPPKPPVRVSPAVSQKEIATATEYLLSRSAGRSEAPVIVDGKRLPTEEQMLSMPDSAYMNAEQLAFFRHRLQQIEREILSNADETTEHLRETVIVPDPADRATIEEEHALELRTRDRERKLLKKVQASLAQIEAGEYGFCEETGDPIGVPRLLARPTATLSLEAQQRREIKQKLFGD